MTEDGDTWLVAVIVGILVTAIISLIVLAKLCHEHRNKTKVKFLCLVAQLLYSINIINVYLYVRTTISIIHLLQF